MNTTRVVVRGLLALVLCTSVAVPVVAQGKDLRDTVTLKSGKKIKGRVARDFDPEKVLVMQGGKRVRVDCDSIASTDTVRARLFEFLDQRMKAKQNVRFHWSLAEWAVDRELHAMARLQALTVLELDDTHEKAHQFLGHKLSKKKGWTWPVKSRRLTRAKFEEHYGDMGHPLTLESEHFRILTDGGIKRAVEALIDLERMYRFWFQTWGQRLQLAEALDLMEVQVWNDEDKFPGWTGEPVAYFVPHPFADRSYTFFSGVEDRPSDLFAVGTQHLLYECLANDSNPGGQRERFCDWVEIGLGEWMQARMRGAAGRAEVMQHQIDQWEADAAYVGQLKNGYYRHLTLQNVLHWTLRDHFYGTIYSRNQSRSSYWATAHMFVAFLMNESADKQNPSRLMNYLRAALAEGKGDSSNAFDQAMTKPIEKLKKPFREWLQSHASPSVGR